MSVEICDRPRCGDMLANHDGPCRAAGCTCPAFTNPRRRREDDIAAVRAALEVLVRHADESAPAVATGLARLVTAHALGDDLAPAPGNRLTRIDAVR